MKNSKLSQSFFLNKVSWRYIKRIYVISRPWRVFSNSPSSLQFRIFNPSGENNEFYLMDTFFESSLPNMVAIRLISLLKYSGANLNKKTLITLLKTHEGCELVKQMIFEHFQEVLKCELDNDFHNKAGFYNFTNNREKWMRKNIFQDTN